MIQNYKCSIYDIIDEFCNTQIQVLEHVAKIAADKISNGGQLYVVGSGHSHMIGEEFYARAGGLSCVQLIAPMELTLGEHPLKSTQVERISEYAFVILTQYNVTAKDIILISSNSGRNRLPVELALECKKRDITTVAFTNLSHSKEVASRHKSGRMLYQVCDHVIDNCGKTGDAFMNIEGVEGKMGASSSIVGMFMAQSLSMLIAQNLTCQGVEVPIFMSANLDEGDDWNKKITKE